VNAETTEYDYGYLYELSSETIDDEIVYELYSAEEDDIVVKAIPASIPALFVLKGVTGELITRKNEPLTIVEYEEVGDLFVRVEPTLRKIQIDKEGNMSMGFSNEMVFPYSWQDKLQSDTATLEMEANGTLVGRRRL